MPSGFSAEPIPQSSLVDDWHPQKGRGLDFGGGAISDDRQRLVDQGPAVAQDGEPGAGPRDSHAARRIGLPHEDHVGLLEEGAELAGRANAPHRVAAVVGLDADQPRGLGDGHHPAGHEVEGGLDDGRGAQDAERPPELRGDDDRAQTHDFHGTDLKHSLSGASDEAQRPHALRRYTRSAPDIEGSSRRAAFSPRRRCGEVGSWEVGGQGMSAEGFSVDMRACGTRRGRSGMRWSRRLLTARPTSDDSPSSGAVECAHHPNGARRPQRRLPTHAARLRRDALVALEEPGEEVRLWGRVSTGQARWITQRVSKGLAWINL